MLRLSTLDDEPCWFVVLPDQAGGEPIAAVLRRHAPRARQVDHPSGRPWLVGRWADGDVALGSAAGTSIAVIGQHDATADQLTRHAEQVRDLPGLDAVAAAIAGSFHLVASVGGQVRAQGSVSGLRRVFHADRAGTPVAGDRAGVLAALIGASLDDRQLAVNLLAPYPPWPLFWRSGWHRVHTVEPDHYLALDAGGGPRAVRWWSPPAAALSLHDGAAAVRAALRCAVQARTGAGGVVACDLSGLDSSSLCSLAAGGPAKVVALTAAGIDPMDDDVLWATRTAAELAPVHHEVLPTADVPLVFDALTDAVERVDQPGQMTVNRSRFMALTRRAAAYGARLHLLGVGGDELFYPLPAHLHAALRSRPVTAVRLARQYAARFRWPIGQTLVGLAGNGSYRRWLARAAQDVTAGPVPFDRPLVDWAVPPRLPQWTTARAAELVREALVEAAGTAAPMAPARGRHTVLEMVRLGAGMARYFAELGARHGVPIAVPYFDDRVVEACLSVDPLATLDPRQYKPLLVAAMAGVAPEVTLGRTTKADTYAAMEQGLSRHRGSLLALGQDSELERRGLVDPARWREAVRRPIGNDGSHMMLYATVAVETWLRMNPDDR